MAVECPTDIIDAVGGWTNKRHLPCLRERLWLGYIGQVGAKING